jgi:hypothetical protein
MPEQTRAVMACPICQSTWDRLYVTYLTWIARPYDALYYEAHTQAAYTYLRHRMRDHALPRARTEPHSTVKDAFFPPER